MGGERGAQAVLQARVFEQVRRDHRFQAAHQERSQEIADIMLKDVFNRTEEKGITLDVTERFKDRLVDEGFNPAYGSRPLRRAIMRLMEDGLAEKSWPETSGREIPSLWMSTQRGTSRS